MGCSKKDAPKPDSKNEPEAAIPDKKPPLNVGVSEGDLTRRNAKGQKVWFITWKSADLKIIDGKQSGTMQTVSGQAFENEVVSSTFRSNSGEADAKTDRLILKGQVRIDSPSEKSFLLAERVDWIPEQKVFRASGKVSVEGPNGILGPTDTLFVTPKLDRVATSESYFKK